MSARATRCVELLRDALRALPELGTDGVQVGWPTPGEVRSPAVWLMPGRVTGTRDGSTVEYRRDFTIDVAAYSSGEDPPLGSLSLAAAEFASAITSAVENAVHEDGQQTVMDVTVGLDTLSGDEMGIPGVGVCFGKISVWWYATQGEGT